MYARIPKHHLLRRGGLATSAGARNLSLSSIQRREFRDATPKVFEEVVLKGGSTPVVVDFYASWCQPCTMLSPILHKYTADPSNIDGKEVDLMTVNVDEQQELAAKYKVTALPTVIGFKNGKQASEFVGLLNPAGVRKFIMDL